MNGESAKVGMDSLLGAWIKASSDYWLNAARDWPKMPDLGEGFAALFAVPKSPTMESWQSSIKVWQAMAASFSQPDALETLLKGASASPEITMKMIRTVWDGYFNVYQHWVQKLGKLGETTEPYKFENLDQEVFKHWLELYEKEIQPYLKAPQLGLNRFYQERANQLIDRYNLYQAAMSELMHIIYVPLEKSVKVMQDKFEDLAREGQLSENFKDYYNMWIKILEGHYMTLFKSPEYLQSLSKTLTAVADYKTAQHQMLTDLLQALPIPTHRDMDDLSKELYLLKKRVKELEARLPDKA